MGSLCWRLGVSSRRKIFSAPSFRHLGTVLSKRATRANLSSPFKWAHTISLFLAHIHNFPTKMNKVIFNDLRVYEQKKPPYFMPLPRLPAFSVSNSVNALAWLNKPLLWQRLQLNMKHLVNDILGLGNLEKNAMTAFREGAILSRWFQTFVFNHLCGVIKYFIIWFVP